MRGALVAAMFIVAGCAAQPQPVADPAPIAPRTERRRAEPPARFVPTYQPPPVASPAPATKDPSADFAEKIVGRWANKLDSASTFEIDGNGSARFTSNKPGTGGFFEGQLTVVGISASGTFVIDQESMAEVRKAYESSVSPSGEVTDPQTYTQSKLLLEKISRPMKVTVRYDPSNGDLLVSSDNGPNARYTKV